MKTHKFKSSPVSTQNGNSNWDREEQIRQNQPAIELLKQRIAKNQLMSEEESNQRAEFLASFQKNDADIIICAQFKLL